MVLDLFWVKTANSNRPKQSNIFICFFSSFRHLYFRFITVNYCYRIRFIFSYTNITRIRIHISQVIIFLTKLATFTAGICNHQQQILHFSLSHSIVCFYHLLHGIGQRVKCMQFLGRNCLLHLSFLFV